MTARHKLGLGADWRLASDGSMVDCGQLSNFFTWTCLNPLSPTAVKTNIFGEPIYTSSAAPPQNVLNQPCTQLTDVFTDPTCSIFGYLGNNPGIVGVVALAGLGLGLLVWMKR